MRRERVKIGPLRAAELLGLNSNNRPLDNRRVERYAADMAAGRWLDTGIPIIVWLAGESAMILQDGQHRLEAVIRSGVAIFMDVVYVDAPVYAVIDDNKPRTLQDRMHTDPTARRSAVSKSDISAGASAIAVWDILIPYGANAYDALSHGKRLEIMRENMAEAEWAGNLRRAARRGTAKYPPIGFLAAALGIHRLDALGADTFFASVSTGEAMFQGEPEYTLRQYLIHRSSSATGKGYTTHRMHAEAVIRCWNARAQRRSLVRVQLMGDIPAIETPKPAKISSLTLTG